MTLALLLAVATCPLNRGPLEGLPAEIERGLGAVVEVAPCTVRTLPAPVRKAMAERLGEKALQMANPGEKWSDGCLRVEGMATRRLLYGGRAGSRWVVHFEVGGWAIQQSVMILNVEKNEATVEWVGHCFERLPKIQSLVESLREPVNPSRWECSAG